MITFDYFCDSCRKVLDNHHMDSFQCKCGGTMRLLKNVDMIAFEPFYSKELGTLITSAKQEEKLLAAKGYSYLDDHKKMKDESKQLRRHKEEYTREAYAKMGVKYIPGSNTKFDEQHGDFVPRNGPRQKRCMVTISLVLTLLFGLNPVAGAKIREDLPYATVTIHGKQVSFPIASSPRVNDIYLLKKLLSGDKEARELFLGGENVRYFPAGDNTARWIKVTKDSEEVVPA